ncbi:MAG: nucleotidyl transferase AbiEii/AbiGii toxin family protein [Candidatus Margulisbacteria bacterium]|nr:nucleotidyl transferase AbiEii/AbiGii toxin family protein [Candidatus Margulisiibacteriota bacterium]
MTENGISLLTNKDKFRKMIQYTQERTRFTPLLLEKDFYLTLVLHKISQNNLPLVFKGGTCLNKCYLGYYRLSEDLDFVYLNKNLKTRSQRRKQFSEIETRLKPILSHIPGLVKGDLEKFDEHHQARLMIHYDSVFDEKGRIQIEITHRHPLRLKPVNREISHCFKDPFSNDNVISSKIIQCMDLKEVAAEKIRACFTRKIPAIRDYFDLWYLRTQAGFNFSDSEFLRILKKKLDESKVFVGLDQQIEVLKKQVRQELLPTISNHYDFDLDKTIQFIKKTIKVETP